MTTHIRLQRRNFAVGHEKTAVFDKKKAVLVARCTKKDILLFCVIEGIFSFINQESR